jgi:hypothetical protein
LATGISIKITSRFSPIDWQVWSNKPKTADTGRQDFVDSQDEKSAGPEPFPQLLRDTALQRFVEIGEDEIAAED